MRQQWREPLLRFPIRPGENNAMTRRRRSDALRFKAARPKENPDRQTPIRVWNSVRVVYSSRMMKMRRIYHSNRITPAKSSSAAPTYWSSW